MALEPTKPVALTGFFEEVKRRKVYRVAAAYVIAAGRRYSIGLGCVSGVGIAELDPAGADRCLLLIGFPVALMLAWAFDITARWDPAHADGCDVQDVTRRRNMILLRVRV